MGGLTGSALLCRIDMRPVVDGITHMATLDLTPVMASAAEGLVAEVSDRFDSEGDGEWPPLAASTLARRRQKQPKILQATGRLAKSIRAFFGPDWAEAATDVSYVVYHLEGGPVIPKRNPFEITEDAWKRVEDGIAEDVAELMGVP